MNFLQIKNLHITLGNFFLKNINLSIEKGDYLTIIGPTGSGKTILLECIIGFYKPKQGQILLEGKNIVDLAPCKRNIGIVYQDYALLPNFTVFDNIAYGLRKKEKSKLKIKAKVLSIAQKLQIDDLLSRFPETLSGGEQQRVALARALIVNPKLLLMDEPLSALDINTKRELRILLKQTTKEFNTTIIHVTHDLDDVWSLANKVAFFKKGELLQFGTIKEIFSQPKTKFIAKFIGTDIFEARVQRVYSSGTLLECNGCILHTTDFQPSSKKVFLCIKPDEIMIFLEPPQKLPNIFPAYIEHIFKETNLFTLHLKSNNFSCRALMTYNMLKQLNLRPGKKVFIYLKPENLKIIPQT
ncbi:molybdate transport system ATP-binding protein [Desulfonauticus submarinus]|uniref:Molybdate transport system ATP-binding protein n=1 Tax=Desulfonauticus submarinus TaxID=206665 RepID=A0A1H0FGU9_9BACT|nr:ATP-binding cassette domain-containing protein [Desulfonauticus submarinus]SDN93903.1 molybdate transport system ATP-binding protein [Desulfonauticus submarinus]